MRMQQKLNGKVECRVKANSYGYNNNGNIKGPAFALIRETVQALPQHESLSSAISVLCSFSSLIETLKRFLAVGGKGQFSVRERGGDAEYAFGGQDLRRWGSEL